MAALNQYTLTRRTHGAPDNDGGLLALVSPTLLSDGNSDNYQALDVSIGFTFELAGASHTLLRAVNQNGYVRLSTTNFGGDDNSEIDATSNSVVIAPWWADNAMSNLGGSKLRTELQGTSPNRIRIVDWTEMRAKQASGPQANQWTGEEFSFQLCLYETSNRIEFRYGTAADLGSAFTPIGPTKGGAVGVKLDTTGGQSGNIRDFFGSSGTPAGSAGPFTRSHTILRGGIEWPSDASNTSGLGAYNWRFEYVPPDPTLTYPANLWMGDGTRYQSGYTVDVTIGGDTETWTATGANVLGATQDLLAWLHDDARPWWPVVWQAAIAANASSAADLSIAADVNWTWEASEANGLGIPTSAPSAALTLTTGKCDATWCPAAGLALTRQQLRGLTGDAGNGICVMRGAPGTMLLQPQLETVATAIEAGQLAAALAQLSNPRTCYVQHDGNLVALSVGRMDRQRAGTMHYRIALDVSQEV